MRARKSSNVTFASFLCRQENKQTSLVLAGRMSCSAQNVTGYVQPARSQGTNAYVHVPALGLGAGDALGLGISIGLHRVEQVHGLSAKSVSRVVVCR